MIAIVCLQLWSMKGVVLIESQAGKASLTFVQWTAFALGWFGMRPSPFEKLFTKPLNNVRHLFWKGVSRILFGFILLYASRLVQQNQLPIYFLAELLALVGLSFVLHFGILNISTAFWRYWGVDVRELFRAPYKSQSIKEFWGKRWNLAFSEMTAIIAYKPLKRKLGNYGAIVAAFLFSGILHEIAISLPVMAGFGLPLVYFILHSLAMYLEEKMYWVKKALTLPYLPRLWTMAWLILPLPLLFHHHFVGKVVFPLRELLLFW